EALQGLRVAGHVVGQKLESDKTAQACVLGLVNHAHSAATQFFQDAVMRDGLADEGVGIGHATNILGSWWRQVNEGQSHECPHGRSGENGNLEKQDASWERDSFPARACPAIAGKLSDRR